MKDVGLLRQEDGIRSYLARFLGLQRGSYGLVEVSELERGFEGSGLI